MHRVWECKTQRARELLLGTLSRPSRIDMLARLLHIISRFGSKWRWDQICKIHPHNTLFKCTFYNLK